MTDEARALTLERGNLNVYRTLANAEKTFTGWMIAGREHLTSPVISPRLRELVILRTGHLMDSRYELAQHVGVDQGRQAYQAVADRVPGRVVICP